MFQKVICYSETVFPMLHPLLALFSSQVPMTSEATLLGARIPHAELQMGIFGGKTNHRCAPCDSS